METLLRYAVVVAWALPFVLIFFAVASTRYTKPVGYDDDQPKPNPRTNGFDNADHLRDANPWRHEPDPIKLAVLGKTVEEAGELIAALGRCIIQGVDEAHPVTGKRNIDWLNEEHIDVTNMLVFLRKHVTGNFNALMTKTEGERMQKKQAHITQWLQSIQGHPPPGNYGPDNEGLPDISTGYHMFADGNAWCAVGPTYVDLVQSNAGFGYTYQEAYDDWWRCNVLDNTAVWAGRQIPKLADFQIHLPTVAPNGR